MAVYVCAVRGAMRQDELRNMALKKMRRKVSPLWQSYAFHVQSALESVTCKALWRRAEKTHACRLPSVYTCDFFRMPVNAHSVHFLPRSPWTNAPGYAI